ncbi:histidine phosphatase family protein [Sphaerisporangium sp. NPDC051011]|uniref:histidine phosphatase family protein n=1 Tax=Sphaerisporangium sp. NPDC051011 TaxID=3155792 RepID=UPI0033E694B6
MTARIVLISHAATTALQRAAFPMDEPLTDQALRRLTTARPLFSPPAATTTPRTPTTAGRPPRTADEGTVTTNGEQGASKSDGREAPALEEAAALGPSARKVLCGPSQRCLQTAAGLGLEAEPVEALRDWDAGRWAGRTLADVQAEHPEDVLAWLTDPASAPHGGESLLALLDRVTAWLATLHDAGRTLAVTHPAVIRAAVVHALDAPPQAFWKIDVPPLAQVTLTSNGRRWHLRLSAP